MTEEYNGWSNRETWAINLHMSNNEGDYKAMHMAARDYLAQANIEYESWNTPKEQAIYDMAEDIKQWTEEVFASVTDPEDDYPPTEEARMFVADVGSWWRADFQEIAEHWISDAMEES